MTSIVQEKLDQAVALLPEFEIDCWLILGRETGELCDLSLPLILNTAVTWQSAFLVHAGGERIAIVGRYDVQNVQQSGGWTKVLGYDEDIAGVLRAELERLHPQRIGLNYSKDNHTSDGLTFGMYLSLLDWLRGTPFQDRLVSADHFASALRARKSSGELSRMQKAIGATVAMFTEVPALVAPGRQEQQLQHALHERVDQLGAGTSWEREYCPMVNFGPESAGGHTGPSSIAVEPGHVVHLDFGIKLDGYCADLQRCWYVAESGQKEPPAAVQRGFDAVRGAIQAAADYLRPGRTGAEVDAVARRFITAAGYDEYKHALGHQVGRTCHDGGTLLGPRWARYGNTVEGQVAEGEVYTLELEVNTPHGMVGLEEMVVITADGCRYLTEPQTSLPIINW